MQFYVLWSLACISYATVPRLRYIRALGIKHLFGIDKCLCSLNRGKNRFPSDITLSYSYYDHLLSKNIKMADYTYTVNH